MFGDLYCHSACWHAFLHNTKMDRRSKSVLDFLGDSCLGVHETSFARPVLAVRHLRRTN
jgi:hypothetical protein